MAAGLHTQEHRPALAAIGKDELCIQDEMSPVSF